MIAFSLETTDDVSNLIHIFYRRNFALLTFLAYRNTLLKENTVSTRCLQGRCNDINLFNGHAFKNDRIKYGENLH